jgi:hypothetical protein
LSFKSFILSAVLICVCAASCAAADSWKELSERGDFKIADRDAVMERAYEEIANVYGTEVDIDSLKKAKSYVSAVHSEEYKADVAVTLIEDRGAEEADCYYEVALEVPTLDCLAVGSVWIDDTLDGYLDDLIETIYGEYEYDEPVSDGLE